MFNHAITPPNLHEYALTSLSFGLCVGIIFVCSWLPWLSGRTCDLSAVQSMHTRATPRVGGIAIFGALGLFFIFGLGPVSGTYPAFVLIISILFFVGLAEDFGFRMSPRLRMLAVISSSLLTIWLFGVWLPRTGIPVLDPLMEYSAVGIPLTILVTAGISNGFNLIDGVNGLASLTAIVTALALSQIAEISGYSTMVHLPMFVAAGVFGFFLINYPFGLIFLGDAGAYTIGFVLSWFGIAVLVNAPEVSPWAILLTFFWPAADTSLAIYRRLRRSADISAPDRLHVHQMMMRGLEICVLGQNRRQISNPLTTLVLAPFVIAPPIVGILLWNQNWNAFLAVLFFGSLLFVTYVAAPGLIRRFRR